ncbi:two component signal transduction system response regulator [Thermosynechococcus sp. NK55a]|uniref:two-component system response regulator RppA n=1 Tax=Thermosynechococcus sp. NK55a TaxID=1394889 RepID=UPI0003D80F04|nr:two-component system response regulator RppA [Thermosynechococcus sp. NK55a]AHB88572.1 two component signal transduction system response regulator [Thermosynechococcus sp. NK55a]
MRILFVEDDPEQLEPLSTALSHKGHLVDGVQEGETAQWLIQEKTYDLLILDWMLPKVSGVELCTQCRQQGKNTPILLLTAKDTTADKVMGLDAGADDYLIKPVDVMELLARVRALGRRSPQWLGDQLHLQDLVLDLSSMKLKRGDRTLLLSRREYQFLEFFLRHPGQVITREQLELNLWEWDNQPESNAVSTQIRRLRLRLEEVGCADWLETIYGMGYRLQANS